MKIGILSRKRELYSTRRLIEAAESRGHSVRVIDPLRCYMSISASNPSIHFRGEPLNDFDAIVPRIGASVTFYGTAVVRQFEMMGVYCLNESQAITRARDKLRSNQLLARAGVGLPVTGFAHSPDDTHDVISLIGEPPFVIKLLEGTQGKGVVLTETKNAAGSVIDAFRDLDAYFLVQEFVKEASGCDIRCFVVGNRVVASMMRKAKDGEFRSNLHRGGRAMHVEVTPEECAMAIKAAEIMGLNVAGVDIIRAKKGPLVLEVNSSPGLEGIEKSTSVDVASLIIEFIEKNAAPGKTATRGSSG
ncbi:MAG TPA: 30S ribosomal protein S6--L-glutamate ligase [Bdellovibrionales bacterium]|nr:30S ribosomal protein S6--L-glutamate ligase [Bdellovibrionales bacterium]